MTIFGLLISVLFVSQVYLVLSWHIAIVQKIKKALELVNFLNLILILMYYGLTAEELLAKLGWYLF